MTPSRPDPQTSDPQTPDPILPDLMLHERVPEAALHWHRAGRGAVLVTVVEIWGSALRRAGSQMAVSGAGEMLGSVSGGCVEGAVVGEALGALAKGAPRLLTYGVSDETAFAAGLACGGTIKVLVEPVGSDLPEPLLATLVEARAARRPVVYAADPDGGARRLLSPGEDAAADARLRSDRAGMEEDGRFLLPLNPPLRLFVVGAVHIAQPLIAMARLAGYDPTLIDPRTGFATPARFPGTPILDDWPDEALARLAPDSRSAIVTLTHDAKIDDPAIRFALRSPVFYLGCLGSVKTHGKRRERLAAEGVTEAELARIHAPVGLAIGARSPAEIAISILAEMTRILRGQAEMKRGPEAP